MIALNISEAARLAEGKMIGRDGIIKRVSTDSRDVDGDCLFAAIKGERFDGHDFVEKSMGKWRCLRFIIKRDNDS